MCIQSTSEIRTVRISDRSILFGSNYRSVVFNAEIRTHLFGFQTFIVIPKTEQNITERSDFGQLTKLGRFIYKDRHKKNSYLYKTV